MLKYLIAAVCVAGLGIGSAMAEQAGSAAGQNQPAAGQSGAQSEAMQDGAAKKGSMEKSMEKTMDQAAAATGSGITLTKDEVETWKGRAVYDNAGKEIGDIAAFKLSDDGRVQEMHIDVGGLLGIGETRRRVEPDNFRFEGERAVLSLPEDQIETLPEVKQ